ncbi:hypothetical protein D9757_006611 [Collybiopsis confluens]|uniref:O-methyltransferase C-terminal domain-containing protein n=1 Tax=Collybiopsis confluens TaxID=2823264 RepID=A0A8H5HQZ0_9AGAR|nr:hypothetical protein D9757_006611 [Collybiopsis confluens]
MSSIRYHEAAGQKSVSSYLTSHLSLELLQHLSQLYSMTFKDLKALHLLIGSAIAQLESRFQECGEDYPALDSSYQDSTVDLLSQDLQVLNLSNQIVAAAGHVIAIVRSPFNTVVHTGMAFLLSVSLREVEAAHVVEILRAAGQKGLPIQEIAACTGRDPSKLGHVLRFLATHHIFKEVHPNVFANNRISSYIDTKKDVNAIMSSTASNWKYMGTSGMAAFVAVAGDEFLKSAAHLSEVMRDTDWGQSRLPTETAFNAAWSTHKGFFEFMQEDRNKPRMERLGHALMATEQFSKAGSIIECFPWKTLSDAAVVVDVGGGSGRSMQILAERFDHLECFVQDLPRVCEIGRKIMGSTFKVAFQDHNFFDPQPIRNASVFYLRTILHDWSDTHAISILRHLRNAAQPRTRLIIAEHLLISACHDVKGESLLEHPVFGAGPKAPLLRNLGIARSTAYMLDLNMQIMFNGQERMLDEMTHLVNISGWKIESVHSAEFSLFTHFVAAPA